jgi:hypothetical protein
MPKAKKEAINLMQLKKIYGFLNVKEKVNKLFNSSDM